MDAADAEHLPIANFNLRTFTPHKANPPKLARVAISEGGSRFCMAYGDGTVSIVDRNSFLLENPQRRSRAFNYSFDEESTSPTVESLAVSSCGSPPTFTVGL